MLTCQLWQLLAAVVELRGRERRPWPRRARMERLPSGPWTGGARSPVGTGRQAGGCGDDAGHSGFLLRLSRGGSVCLVAGLCCPHGLPFPRGFLADRWAWSCPGIQLAEGIQGRVVVCWTILGGYPASELRSDPMGRGRWRVAHSCLRGCRAASAAPLCLEFLPLNLSFYGKCPPAPCSPIVGNRIIYSQKTR